ncbi:periphilin-1 isoform X3 [Thalassophryne amazonica]|uniref:periphilin-1 isoform X3 n=1 Tax=Thalassophryne amazonica TaxID=390379 RepID=UPI00147245D2|nr:periphilin-1 isoform X3 [Thalassophryne amazonica]
MTYRRERIVREVYDDRYLPERPGPYPRAAGPVERRGPFGRSEDDYGRGGYDYDGGSRFYPNGGGRRSFHIEDQRGYHGDGHHFPAELRAGPSSRRDDYPYRGPREDQHTGRPLEFGEEREQYRRKMTTFPPLRERSPVRREVARSPHSRSGSSVSSKGYSPDRAKTVPFPSKQDKIPGLSREGSPHSATSIKEESHPPEAEKEPPVVEANQKSAHEFQERRALAIAAKAQEIEKVYRQDCETFGMVVKMLVSKDPGLEKQLQVPLRENLGEIRERCLDDLKHFIKELDEVVRQPEPAVCDSSTPSTSVTSQKFSKTGLGNNSAY